MDELKRSITGKMLFFYVLGDVLGAPPERVARTTNSSRGMTTLSLMRTPSRSSSAMR